MYHILMDKSKTEKNRSSIEFWVYKIQKHIILLVFKAFWCAIYCLSLV